MAEDRNGAEDGAVGPEQTLEERSQSKAAVVEIDEAAPLELTTQQELEQGRGTNYVWSLSTIGTGGSRYDYLVPELLAVGAREQPAAYLEQLNRYVRGEQVSIGGNTFRRNLSPEEVDFAELIRCEMETKEGRQPRWYEYILISTPNSHTVHGHYVTFQTHGVPESGKLVLSTAIVGGRVKGYIQREDHAE